MKTILLKRLAILAISTAGILVSLPALADNHGSHPHPLHNTISEIIGEPKNGEEVHIDAKVVRQEGNNKYVVSDGSGEMIINVSNSQIDLQPNTEVDVLGTVNIEDGKSQEIEILVKEIKIVE